MKHTTSFQCTVIKQTVKSVNITNAIDFNFFGKQCYDFVIDDESMNNPQTILEQYWVNPWTIFEQSLGHLWTIHGQSSNNPWTILG